MTKGLKRIWDAPSPSDTDPSVSQYQDHQECGRSEEGYSYLIRFAQQRTHLAARHYQPRKSLHNHSMIQEVGSEVSRQEKKQGFLQNMFLPMTQLLSQLWLFPNIYLLKASLAKPWGAVKLSPCRKVSLKLQTRWNQRWCSTLAAS